MRSQESRGSDRRRGGRRPQSRDRRDAPRAPQRPPEPQSLWQKIVAFFKPKSQPANGSYPKADASRTRQAADDGRSSRQARKPENVEVTSPKLYVGNLNYSTTENDLSELFNGVGAVTSAEIVTHKESEKSKGFGFVTMTTIDEAKRAVTELHDKDFMGRKLVVSGAKTGGY